jgi:phage shock protein A
MIREVTLFSCAQPLDSLWGSLCRRGDRVVMRRRVDNRTLIAMDAGSLYAWRKRGIDMDLVNALSAYRVALIEAIGKLDSFPEELKEFAVEERRHLEAAIKQIEEHLTEAANAAGGLSQQETKSLPPISREN